MRSEVGFDYRHPVRHPVPVSPDTVILLPTPSTRYRHLVLDDGYRITVEFWCGTRWRQYRSGTGWRYWMTVSGEGESKTGSYTCRQYSKVDLKNAAWTVRSRHSRHSPRATTRRRLLGGDEYPDAMDLILRVEGRRRARARKSGEVERGEITIIVWVLTFFL